MKQISNWVFGSFFRTIGRVLVFILLGIVIAHFIDFGSLKDSFSITDLFFDKVSALSLDGTHTGQLKVFNNAPIREFGSLCQNTATDTLRDTYIYFDNNIQNLDSDFAVFSFAASEQEYFDTTDVQGDFYTNRLTNMILKISLVSNNAAWGNCEFQGNQIVCPMQHLATYTALQIAYVCPTSSGNEVHYLTMFINDFVEFYKNDKEATKNAIEQQTQQQQQQHDEIMDTNMTETNETATSFFDSFESEDIGGLSGIVTAPLNMINKMLDGSCTSPSATWKGATISLPCGDMFWNRPGAGDIKNLLNIFYGGFLCYYAIRKLFLMVENLKDPTQDRIEVSDL